MGVDRELSDIERKAHSWLTDRNQIQRNVALKSSGKKRVREQDISGGQAALIAILKSDAPIHPLIRETLARALEPIGSSLLILQKRLRRRPGRPAKKDTVRLATSDAFEVHTIERDLKSAKEKVKRTRPLPVAVMKPKSVSTAKAIKKLPFGKTKAYTLRRRRKQTES